MQETVNRPKNEIFTNSDKHCNGTKKDAVMQNILEGGTYFGKCSPEGTLEK